MRGLTIVAIAMVCLVAYPACAIPVNSQFVSDSDLLKERAALKSAVDLAQQKDAKSTDIRNLLQNVVANAAFSALTPQERHAAYLLLGAAQYDSQDLPAALATLRTSSEMEDATGYDWKLRLYAAYGLNDNNDCILSLTKLATMSPDQIRGISDQAIFSIVDNAAKSNDQAPGLELLLRTLFVIKWQPNGINYTVDELWFALARIELEHGDLASARDTSESITRPTALIEIRADKRFDPVVSANPAHYDVGKAAQNRLHELEAAVVAAPDKLEVINALADELINLNHPSEALALVDTTLAQAEPHNGELSKYVDYNDNIIWLHNARAHVLWVLNRYKESAQEMANGAKLNERGGLNVSQAINLADTYNAMARPDDALAATSKIGKLSPYGQMALEEAKACAYYQLHDMANLEKFRSYLDSHIADAIRPYIGAMFCIDDLDAAAKAVIAELEHPQRRNKLLSYMQDYLDLPPHLPFDIDMSREWKLLKNRGDVRAEISKVGHIEKYSQLSPLY